MSARRNPQRGRFGFTRPYHTRPPLPIITIVCDDTRTAVAYFTEIKRELKAQVTVNVIRAACTGATASAVVRQAALIQKQNKPLMKDDTVWVLIDLEAELARRRDAQQVKANAPKGVNIALSDPCFEIWTLAHLADTGEAFADCAAVVTRIKVEWRNAFGTNFGPKGQADYSKLMPRRDLALERCRKRNAATNRSWTEVYKVVDAILRAARASEA